jgi:ribonuclease D
VQISDGQTVWLVDPLASGSLQPLREMLEDPSILKIVHSPSEDLDVLLHAVGAVPDPMTDTQLACALLGKPLQMGYHTAVEWLLDVAIDKDQTRSNWCARPLRQAQLRYAALDVCLLPEMWRILQSRLDTAGRLEWLHQDTGKQLAKARRPLNHNDSWLRIRGHGRLDGEGLAILQALAAWREKEAHVRNRPRGFIVPDPVLLRISRAKADSISGLGEIDELHPRALQRHGEAILTRIRQVLDSGRKMDVIKPMTNAQRQQLASMRKLVESRAANLQLEPTLLASKRDLEALILNGREAWPERLLGWRKSVLGSDFERLLDNPR